MTIWKSLKTEDIDDCFIGKKGQLAKKFRSAEIAPRPLSSQNVIHRSRRRISSSRLSVDLTMLESVTYIYMRDRVYF